MAVQLNPYLNFRGTARQALDFYRTVFGGDLTATTFAEFNASEDPAEQDKIMHGELRTDNGLVLMAADLPNSTDFSSGSSVSVSLSGDDERTLRGYWDKLSEGGSEVMPFNKAPWGDHFGMCIDRFGTSWLVNIAGA